MAYIKPKPKPGETYIDFLGRELIVEEVKIPEGNGREVIGRLVEGNYGQVVKYCTTLEMWRETWRDKRAPAPSIQ